MQITAVQSQLTSSTRGAQARKMPCCNSPKNYSDDSFSNSNNTNQVAFKASAKNALKVTGYLVGIPIAASAAFYLSSVVIGGVLAFGVGLYVKRTCFPEKPQVAPPQPLPVEA